MLEYLTFLGDWCRDRHLSQKRHRKTQKPRAPAAAPDRDDNRHACGDRGRGGGGGPWGRRHLARARWGADVIAPLMPVGVMEVEIEPGYAATRTFTGQIEAAATTDLGFELGGRITRVLVDEGDRVAAGEVLALLDTSALGPERAALEAELAALGADAELARLTLVRNDRLTERGFWSVATHDDARL